MKILQFSLVAMMFAMAFQSCSNAPKGEKAEVSEATEVEAAPTGTDLSINTTGSIVNWTGSKIGSEHTGTLNFSEGTVTVANGEVTGGKLVIDMASLANTDLPDDKKPKLEGHLKSPDFFDVETYPTSTFELTKVTKLEGDADASHLVYGNLTMKDVTKQISFKAKIDVTGNSVSVTTPDFTIDRADFNVKYGSNRFFDDLKDKAINDNVGLAINVSAGA